MTRQKDEERLEGRQENMQRKKEKTKQTKNRKGAKWTQRMKRKKSKQSAEPDLLPCQTVTACLKVPTFNQRLGFACYSVIHHGMIPNFQLHH